MLQVRSTTRRVRDNRVELLRRDVLDLPPRQFARQFQFAVVRVQRSAATLIYRTYNLASVAREYFNRVPIHITENQILSASRKHRDAESPMAFGGCDER